MGSVEIFVLIFKKIDAVAWLEATEGHKFLGTLPQVNIPWGGAKSSPLESDHYESLIGGGVRSFSNSLRGVVCLVCLGAVHVLFIVYASCW